MRFFILLLAVVLTSWVVAQATVQRPPQPAGVANAQTTPIVIHRPTPTPIPQQEAVPASQAQPTPGNVPQQRVVVQSSPNQPQPLSLPVQPTPHKQLTPAEAAMWCQQSGCSASQFSPLVESGTSLPNPSGLKFHGKGRFYTFTLPADVAMDYWNGFTAHHGVQGPLTVEQVAEASIRDFR